MPGEGSWLHGISIGHLAPDLEGDVACSTVLVSGQAMTMEFEVVVDSVVAGQETLRMPR